MRVNGEQWPDCVQVQMLINDKVANDVLGVIVLCFQTLDLKYSWDFGSKLGSSI